MLSLLVGCGLTAFSEQLVYADRDRSVLSGCGLTAFSEQLVS